MFRGQPSANLTSFLTRFDVNIYLCPLGTPLSKVALAGVCVVSEVRSDCEISPGVKSICYNPSDGHLSHSLRPHLT